MQSLSFYVNTAYFPFTTQTLKKQLPSVLLTNCYNDDGLPFSVEVKKTEVGHLFEHILLEYLCQLKIAKGHASATFSGRTKWNWVRDPWGKFHIRLNCGSNDADIFPLALEKTIVLMTQLLKTEQTDVGIPVAIDY